MPSTRRPLTEHPRVMEITQKEKFVLNHTQHATKDVRTVFHITCASILLLTTPHQACLATWKTLVWQAVNIFVHANHSCTCKSKNARTEDAHLSFFSPALCSTRFPLLTPWTSRGEGWGVRPRRNYKVAMMGKIPWFPLGQVISHWFVVKIQRPPLLR